MQQDSPDIGPDHGDAKGKARKGAQDVAKPRKPRRLLRALATFLSTVIFVLILTGGLVIALLEHRVTAPDWLRDQIETRLEPHLNGARLDFGGLEFVMSEGWRPRVRLSHLVLFAPDGAQVARLSHAEASLAMRPLLRGQVQPKRIVVSGVFATLRRDQDGLVSLQLSDAAAPVGQAQSLPQLIESWDQLLLQPVFAALVAVDVQALTLRYEDLRQGRAWTLDGGSIALTRQGDDLRLNSGFSVLTGRDYASLVEANYSSRIGDTRAEFGLSATDIPARDIAAQDPAVGWLGVLDAPISGAMRGQIETDGTFGPVSATLQIGGGVVRPTQAARPIPFEGARTYFTFYPDREELDFAEISVNSEWISGISQGRATLAGIENGQLTEMVGQFSAQTLRFNPEGLLPVPLSPLAASFDLRLQLDPFRLTLGQGAITDPVGHLTLRGDLSADQDGWHMALDGQMDHMTPERLMQIWPEQAAPKPREWVAQNLWAGDFSDLDFALRLEPGQRPFVAVDWAFADTVVQFNKFQPPIIRASGQAAILGDRLSITATGGVIAADQGGDIDITGTSFIIQDMSIKPFTYGTVRALARGSVTSVLSLLNRPPLAVLKDTTFPVDLAQGQARVQGNLALILKPRIPYEDLQFDVTGQITGVESVALVPGRQLRAAQLDLHVDQGQVTVHGAGRMDGVPVTARWEQPIGPAAKGVGGQVTGTATVTPEALQTFDITLPPGSVRGQGQADYALALRPGQAPELSVSSDLTGLTLAIPQLGWRKPEQVAGRLDLTATLGPAARVDAIALNAASLQGTGAISIRDGGGLDRLDLAQLRLGNWLDVTGQLIGRGTAAPDIRITGGRLDLRGLPDGQSSGSGGAGPPLQIANTRLQISETLALHGFSGQFTSSAQGLRGPFQGLLNGQAPVTGQVEPQVKGTAIQVKAPDGGAVFRAAGILEQAHGGPMQLNLVPRGEAGQYNGSLRVTNTRIKDAPVMAAMLNAVSVVGLLDEMAGQGILFSEVEGRFTLTPDTLAIHSASAVGPSIGLSLDGIVDLVNNRLGLRGVISPVYLLNVVGSVLTPRKGEGFIGFNYTLTGPANDPYLEVNPFSGLTPGALREIFRERSTPDTTKQAPTRNVDENGTPVWQRGGDR